MRDAADKPKVPLRSIACRAVLAGAGWWIVSEGDTQAIPAGLAAIAAAVALSLVLAPRTEHRVRALGLLLFLGYFLYHSLLAGLDVARRILHPKLMVDPFIVRVPLSLAGDGPRWLLADTLSLLPGTLSVALEDDMLTLHCLSGGRDVVADVRAAEQRVAQIFGIDLEPYT